MTRARPETPVEQQLRESDGLPGQRAALPPGTLPEPAPDPQGDENRTPPPIEESGAGNWARMMDRAHDDVSLSGNRQPVPAPTTDTAIAFQSGGSAMPGSAVSTDHKFIRRWVEERQGRPTKVRGTDSRDGEGILRIDFREPDDKLEPISWEEFFETFEDRKLGFLHQDETAGGKTSRFFKFVHRNSGG